ncbi:sortase [Candidatus Dojkabacteria bacterium]|uniref:Sortase n=1 Tax=Candidatus Dojkabacteria bacterium TaxID=2099670 RepID=A0A847D0S9_9BACT|nr:sortase [Candidatus Dojkabacteria bacterium]
MSEEKDKKSNAGYLKVIGILLLLLGILIVVYTFQPFIFSYIDYKFTPPPDKEIKVELAKGDEQITTEINQDTQVVFVNNEFGLYIPKIQANAKVIKNIDPYDYDAYHNALISGVAHAKGSAVPSESGNVFLFAHSAVNFYERNKYDVYFYLINELKSDDEVFVSYEGVLYKYRVFEVKIVNKEDVKYLSNYSDRDTLTLMTCYPAGTDWKRTIVVAYRDSQLPSEK